jgi:hypothetical protein
MKNRIKIMAFTCSLLLSTIIYSQSDSLGMPGDNLDLNAVLSIFKQSSSIEDFEKRLNSADTKVNNLDLNNDQQVDYLRVIDSGKNDYHSIVIQDPISKSESQDVAVIELQKKGDRIAHIQIVGDPALYGKDYIIEPKDQPQAQASNSNNNSSNDDVYNNGQNYSNGGSQVMINVWGWPSVNYIYSPGYNYWVSPWYWGYYPGWYSPWAPYYGWYAYHRAFIGFNFGFYGYRTNIYAFPHVHRYYCGMRVSSGYVLKTAPSYGRRTAVGYSGNNQRGSRRAGNQTGNAQRSNGVSQQRAANNGNQRVSSNNSDRSSNRAARVDNAAQNNRVQADQQRNRPVSTERVQRNTNNNNINASRQMQNNGGERRMSNPTHVNFGDGGGARMSGGGGHMGGGFGGGSHMGGGGGGHMGGGGGRR